MPNSPLVSLYKFRRINQDIKEDGTWRKKISLYKFRRINQDIKEDGTGRKKSEKTLLCQRKPVPPSPQVEKYSFTETTADVVSITGSALLL
ncbi:hypothetical protein CEXT_548101 [Caerostris extrusa]|uniref:Uncharacterized protein n=1 Tax=Caerostris extrusa TaxID=172846 RepID=A0AAV4YB43_CAEEX|nr:hypothetical protein CEXT_548101 [Caerostris extrusa]